MNSNRIAGTTAVMLLLVAFISPQARAANLVLASQGKTNFVIVLPSEPASPVSTAANELQSHLQKVTGVELPIVADDKVPSGTPMIVVGPCRQLAQLVPDLDVESLGYDGIVMKTVGDNLILAGQGPRGTLYAVYVFLEDAVGCRWWTSQEGFVPDKPVLEIPPLDVRYAPPLRYREAFYRDVFDGVTAARFKLNGHHHGVSDEYGGHYRFVGFVHTFFPFLPPAKYFEAHPEWYSEINGKRTADRSQLCLTNEEMRKEMVKVVLERLRSDPGAGFISISQNDWHGQCQCQACRAVEAEEGSPSGPLIRFVNAVAEEVEKEFPEVLVETLAYQYTRTPPKLVKPRKNVVVRLCSIECSFVQPLAAGDQNEAFRRDIEGWSKIAPQLFIWDYVTNFSNYLVPHPNMRVLGPNVRYFVDNHTIGLFEQGDAQSTIGDFVRLRAWLLAHLMWNPTLDEKALIDEFLKGYYGPAAPFLREYLDVIHDAGEKSGVYLRCFMSDTSSYLTLDDLNRATRLFAKAGEAVADDPVLARRVRRERLPLDHVWLRRFYALRRTARAEQQEFLGPADPVAACDEFIRLAKEFKVGSYREGRPFSEYEEGLRRRFRPVGPPPEACRGLPDDAWIDLQDNQFRLAEPGKWADMVDDPKASDGKAIRMPGDHYEWATSCPLSDDLAYGNPWQCFVVARVEATAADGPAMTMGIYDSKNRKGLSHLSVPIADVSDGNYRVFDLGTHELNGQIYIWVAPPKRPGEVQAVYVDRIYLVRKGKDGE
ncbi:MAG: DUF4838 domain-containing protein [Planctomycetaceae bacterium]|nr:DUF4838 domain-containing protein [Planctomycetaceae bacterium]